MKLILIGGVSFKDSNSPRIGGTTVLMDNLVEYCLENRINHLLIPTNIYHGRFRSIRNFFYLIRSFWRQVRKGDIAVVNISSKLGIVTLYPMMVVLCRVRGLKVVCRMFAGSIHTYLGSSELRKIIAFHFLKKSKINYFETQELINWFNKNNISCKWFPNVRKPHSYRVSNEYNKRIVYVSQIYKEKGIDILLKLSNRLPEDYIIDVYGPILDEKYSEDFFREYRASYKGVLLPNEVVPQLSKYNIMVFPTYWDAEGYPGVIIEAMSLGMPVISTKIGGIPELIDHEETGILADVKDEEALYNAIMSVNNEKYKRLVDGAFKKYKDYNSDVVNRRVISEIME